MYRNMKTLEEISNELELTDYYGVTMSIAQKALSLALNELIPKKEMKELWTKHLSQACHKRNAMYGNNAFRNCS